MNLTLESVYREHHRFVWRTLRRLGVPCDELEDATQDVFVVAARRLHTFEGRSAVTTWLFSIAVGVSRNARRAGFRAHRRTRALAWFRGGQPPSKPMQDDQVDLIALLRNLHEHECAAIILVELEGFSGAEAARALQVNVHTLYARLRTARRKLATQLASPTVATHKTPAAKEVRWTS